MFDKDQFVEELRAARNESDSMDAISEVIAKAIEDPASIIRALGAPGRGRAEQLYADESITISNIIWGSEMWVPPHDHLMWAVIGVYQGQEDNTFWRDQDGNLQEMGGVSLTKGDVRKLGADAVHSVRNPSLQLCGAIHVYGGDFFGAIPRRHSWNPQTLERGPYDYEFINSLRNEANERMESLRREGVEIA